MLNNIVTR